VDRNSAIVANSRCGSSPKTRHDCQDFFKSLKADPIDQKTFASLAAVRRIQQFSNSSMDDLSSLSFKLNAMTSVSAMMMPEREQAVLLKAMRSLWKGSLQNGASKRLSF
jgi:hypothetical protein